VLITVREIVEGYLRSRGFEGLYHEDECACLAGDLMACGEDSSMCERGYKRACDCGDHDWHVGSEREEAKAVGLKAEIEEEVLPFRWVV